MLRGTATGVFGGSLHLLADALLGAIVLLLLGAVALAWRLGEGPLDVTWAASRLEQVISEPHAEVRVTSASLAWTGFHNGADGPLDIELVAVREISPDGTLLAEAPHASVALSLWPLLVGRLEPRAIAVEQPRLELVRLNDGSFQLGSAPRAAGRTDTRQAPPPQPATLLDELRAATHTHGSGPLRRLRHVAVGGLNVLVHDQPLGLDWRAGASIDLRRLSGGGVLGGASLQATLGSSTISLRIKADVRSDGSGTDLSLSSSPFDPAALARDITRLGATQLGLLASLDAPLSVSLAATLGPRLEPLGGQAALSVGAGTAHLGDGTVALASAHLFATATPRHLAVQDVLVAFAAEPGAATPPPRLTAHGEATRAADGTTGRLALDLDHLGFAELAQYWPAGVGGDARRWITENIVAGTARDLHVELGVALPPDLTHATLTSLSGGFAADEVTGYWLRPVPPIEQGSLRVEFSDLDAVMIRLLAGREGALAVDGSTIRIAGLAHKDQVATIAVPIVGPVSDLMRLLANPRLNLLSRAKLGFTSPSGHVDGVLHVVLPLDAKVAIDDIRIDAEAQLASVHLGAVAAGHDLDDGAFDTRVDSNGLTMSGRARLAGLASTLELAMDFRNGPPTQVLQQLRVGTTVTAAQLAGFGLSTEEHLVGAAALKASYAEQRGGRADIVVDADLTSAALALPLGWSKPVGVAADAHAHVVLDHGRLVGLDDVAAKGPGLLLRSHAEFDASRQILHLDRIVLGRTNATGTLLIPVSSRPMPIQLRLDGPALDLSSQFRSGTGEAKRTAVAAARKPAGTQAQTGRAWTLDARFDQVLLADRAPMAPLVAHVENDGLRITDLSIEAGTPGAQSSVIRASIHRSGTGRVLSLATGNAGLLLRGLGVADNILGGALSLAGRFDDRLPDAPLEATANLVEFRVTDAPTVARLLKAATLFGLVDVLRGPGVSFSRLILPFRYDDRRLLIREARAYSPTLGVTATGTLDLANQSADLHGTVVPAYLINTALGRLPLVGKIFSPERGGGLFAAAFAVKGPLADPSVKVNPLSVLAPGFLRKLFGQSG